MYLKKIKLYHVLIIICFISIATLIFIFASSGGNEQTGSVLSVNIIGNYSVDGQKAQDLTKDTVLDSSVLHTITISGQFSPGIPEGWVLMLPLDNVRATMRINNREVYCFGEEKSKSKFSKTGGNTWGFYISPGITESDDIEITLQNIYTNTVTNVFEEFLSGLSFGHGYELYQTMIREKMPSISIGIIVFFTGAIVFIICAVAGLLKAPSMGRGMALACVTITGGIWIFIDGGYPYVSLLFRNALLFNVIDVLQIFVISVVFIIFIFTCLENETTKIIAQIIVEASLTLLAFAVLAQILGLYDLYEIQSWAIAIGFFAALASVVLLGYEALILKHRQTLFILLSWMPFFVSAFLEVLNYYLRFMPERTAIQYGFTLSVLLQFIQMVRVIRENVNRAKEANRLEHELVQSRMDVMLSQIQPHFLYNALNTIKYLCDTRDNRAGNIVSNFAKFLRGNMDSLSQREPIPLDQELGHLRHYLEIEKLRFQDVTFVFDLQATGFLLPALTVQPLVENAINHGVQGRIEGGTIIISSWEDDSAWYVQVKDDGLGFDPNQLPSDGRSHVGIQNTRARLAAMCNGTLEIESISGEGTAVKIIIPKGDIAL